MALLNFQLYRHLVHRNAIVCIYIYIYMLKEGGLSDRGGGKT
jgi:hypothetical protein